MLATERRNFIAREHAYFARFARPGRSVRAALIGTTALVAASLAAVPTRAQNAWTGSTGSVWNTPGNWNPASPADGPTGTATFGGSSQHNVTFSQLTTSVGTILINTGSNSYSFNLNSGQTLDAGSIVDNSSGIVSFAGGTINGAITQNGPGTLIFNSADSGGSATVNGGTLEADGSITGAIQVSGGTLDGTGTLGATTISRGTMMPGTAGNPTGSLTVASNLVLSSDATYIATFNGASASATNVAGNLQLSGTFVAAAAPGSANSYSASDLYTIFTAGNKLFSNSFFTHLEMSGSFGNFVPYLIDNPSANNVQVGLTAGTGWLGTTPTNGSNFWGTAANWVGGVIPSDAPSTPAQGVATFGDAGAATTVTINTASSAGTLLLTSNATAPFNFNINGGGALTLGTFGIDNNSANAPVFTVGGTAVGGGTLSFVNDATAGDAVIINNAGGATTFGASTSDTASAGTANITNNSGGSTTFGGLATAGSATIINNSGGSTAFEGFNTAGNATITTNSGGTTSFTGASTGGSAVFITNSGGVLSFASAGPTNTNAVTAGAITDSDGIGGQIVLSGDVLTITKGQGSFAGVISGNGALVISGGTTTLTGANTYTGGTLITGGTLVADGTLASAVTVNSGGTLAVGTNGTGTLNVAGGLALNSGADYQATLSSTSNSTTSVAGAATLGGTFTAVAGSGTYVANNLYTVLSTAAANGVTDTFSGLTVSGNFGNVVPYLIYNSDGHHDNVEVELTAGNVWQVGSSTWSTAANWSMNSAPTPDLTLPTSTATFNGTGATVTVDTAATAANMIPINTM